MTGSLSILIPAAGGSRRLGQAKQLVERDGKPLIQHTVNTALSISPAEVIIVTGSRSKDIQSAVDKQEVKWVLNTRWCDGLGGSIAAGVKSVKPSCKGLIILLCDQWRLDKQDLMTLVEAWQDAPDTIVTASWADQTMPPVIFPSDCFKQLQSLSGDKGAQSLLSQQPDRVRTVQMQNAIFDLDTPSQLAEFKNKP